MAAARAWKQSRGEMEEEEGEGSEQIPADLDRDDNSDDSSNDSEVDFYLKMCHNLL